MLLEETELWDRWVVVHIGKASYNNHVAILNFAEIHTRNLSLTSTVFIRVFEWLLPVRALQ